MLNYSNAVPSLSDIAAVTNNNDGFGGNNGWWILIILFAIFGGWGAAGNGYGVGNGYFPQLATQSDVQNGFNQQTLISKIDGQTYGIADLGYALNTQFAQAELSRSNQQAALMAQMNNDFNATNAAITQVRFDNATNVTALTNAINQAAQQIINNDNANYRQLHDENVAAQLAAKDAQIVDFKSRIAELNLAASQQAQNNYIVGELKQCPVPAYVVANPYVSPSCCNNCCG